MYRQILVALDGSKVADRALDHAIQMAKIMDAKLYAVYVVEYPSALYASDLFDIEPYHMGMVNEGKTVLEKAKLHFEQAVVRGEAKLIDSGNMGKSIAAELEEAVKNLAIDLVVMGTHGRRGFQRLMLGSVAEAFVRLSPVPILLIPAGSH